MLTKQQADFAKGIAEGLAQAEAYRRAYPRSVNWKPDTVWSAASRLLRNSKVAARVAELQSALQKKELWTREKSVKALANAYKIALEKMNSQGMTGAVKELNAMHGYNAPEKIDLSSSDGSMSPSKAAESVIAAIKKARETDTR